MCSQNSSYFLAEPGVIDSKIPFDPVVFWDLEQNKFLHDARVDINWLLKNSSGGSQLWDKRN